MSFGSSTAHAGAQDRPAQARGGKLVRKDVDAALDAARLGDDAGFAVVYREFAPRLVRYARGLVGQDANDVSAEAWLQIAQGIRDFQGDGDAFGGWAARIVRNRAIDLMRYRARRPESAYEPDALPHTATGDEAADGALENVSTSEAIALIATLPPDQAEAVLLRVVVGLDAATAGAVVGKRAGTVRVAAHRGLKTLAQRLNDHAQRHPKYGV